jgi:hypothetical protein
LVAFDQARSLLLRRLLPESDIARRELGFVVRMRHPEFLPGRMVESRFHLVRDTVAPSRSILPILKRFSGTLRLVAPALNDYSDLVRVA